MAHQRDRRRVEADRRLSPDRGAGQHRFGDQRHPEKGGRDSPAVDVMQSISLWWLRLRHGWRHRFAPDVLRIGPLHVCRSCTLLYAGIAVGFALWALLPASPWALAIGLGAVLLPSAPPVYTRPAARCPGCAAVRGGAAAADDRRGRRRRCVGRGAGLTGGDVGLLAASTSCCAGRAGRPACNGCPELTAGGICSGFAQQADAFRQYEEAASSMLMSSGQIRSGLRGMP